MAETPSGTIVRSEQRTQQTQQASDRARTELTGTPPQKASEPTKQLEKKDHPKEGPLSKETIKEKMQYIKDNALSYEDFSSFMEKLIENGGAINDLPQDILGKFKQATVFVYNTEQVFQIVEALNDKNNLHKFTKQDLDNLAQQTEKLKQIAQQEQLPDYAFLITSSYDQNKEFNLPIISLGINNDAAKQENNGIPPEPPDEHKPQRQLQTQTESPRQPPNKPPRPPSPPDGPPEEPDAAPIEKEAIRITPSLSKLFAGAVLKNPEHFTPDTTNPLSAQERQQLNDAQTEALNNTFAHAESVSLKSREHTKSDVGKWFDKTKGWVERQVSTHDAQREERIAALQSVGLVNDANKATVETFYHTYFYDGRAKSDIKKFVHDIAEGCKKDGVVNMKKLKQRLSSVQGLLTAFGKEYRADLMVKDFATSYGLLTQPSETRNAITNEIANNVTTPLSQDAPERTYLEMLASFSKTPLQREPIQHPDHPISSLPPEPDTPRQISTTEVPQDTHFEDMLSQLDYRDLHTREPISQQQKEQTFTLKLGEIPGVERKRGFFWDRGGGVVDYLWNDKDGSYDVVYTNNLEKFLGQKMDFDQKQMGKHGVSIRDMRLVYAAEKQRDSLFNSVELGELDRLTKQDPITALTIFLEGKGFSAEQIRNLDAQTLIPTKQERKRQFAAAREKTHLAELLRNEITSNNSWIPVEHQEDALHIMRDFINKHDQFTNVSPQNLTQIFLGTLRIAEKPNDNRQRRELQKYTDGFKFKRGEETEQVRELSTTLFHELKEIIPQVNVIGYKKHGEMMHSYTGDSDTWLQRPVTENERQLIEAGIPVLDLHKLATVEDLVGGKLTQEALKDIIQRAEATDPSLVVDAFLTKNVNLPPFAKRRIEGSIGLRAMALEEGKSEDPHDGPTTLTPGTIGLIELRETEYKGKPLRGIDVSEADETNYMRVVFLNDSSVPIPLSKIDDEGTIHTFKSFTLENNELTMTTSNGERETTVDLADFLRWAPAPNERTNEQ